MHGPDRLLDPGIHPAPLPDVVNHTRFPAQYFQMMDVGDEVFHVLVCRITYDLRQVDGQGHPQPVAVQPPLVETDQFYSLVNTSSTVLESDFAPYKPRCDVLFVHTQAHAPDGRPTPRFPAGVRIGTWHKMLQVTGPRRQRRTRAGAWHVDAPEPAVSVPLRYELAFGGTCQWPLQLDAGHEPELLQWHPPNPLGCGWFDDAWLHRSGITQAPAPQIELPDLPYTDRHANATREEDRYPVVGLGAIGRWWQPRQRQAGTAGDDWKRTRWPRLPLDFDFGYWNCAPDDQQIDPPQGGEEVVLMNLHADGTARLRLPRPAPFALVHLGAGPILPRRMPLDTLVFDMTALRLTAVHRMTLAAAADVRALEVRRKDETSA